LESGLLLVTGPYGVNGVPLRRVNQAYVIPTSAKIDMNVDVSKFNDSYFNRLKAKKQKAQNQGFFIRTNELTEEDKKNIEMKKQD
jgi:large subunit ribosomal protein L6e